MMNYSIHHFHHFHHFHFHHSSFFIHH